MKKLFLFFIVLSATSITHTAERTGPSNTNYAINNVDMTNNQVIIYTKSGFDFLLYHLAQQEARQNNYFHQIIANQNKFCQSINSSLAALSSRVGYLVQLNEDHDTNIDRLETKIEILKEDVSQSLTRIIALFRTREQTHSLWGAQTITATTRTSLRRNNQHQQMDTDRTSSFM